MKFLVIGCLWFYAMAGLARENELPSVEKAICADPNLKTAFSDIAGKVIFSNGDNGKLFQYVQYVTNLERGDRCSGKRLYMGTQLEPLQKTLVDRCLFACTRSRENRWNVSEEDTNHCSDSCAQLRTMLDVYTRAYFAGEKNAKELSKANCEQPRVISNLSRDASKIIEKAPAEKAKVEQSNTIKP